MKVKAPVSDVSRVQDRVANLRETVEVMKPQKQEPNSPEQVTEPDVERLADKMNAAAELFNKSLKFEVFDERRIIIKVIDSSTGEVLTEIPPERLLETFRSMEAYLGLLVDRKV